MPSVTNLVLSSDRIFSASAPPDAGAHRRPGFGDLVADAVEEDARVVVVLADHGLHVRLPPVGKAQCVIVLALRLRPHVEGLVHDEHPQAVAGLEHRPAQGVVRTPDRIEAGLLEELDPALLGPADGGRTEQAVVVVHAGATKQDGLPVDAQAPDRVDRQGADPEGRRLLVEHPAVVEQGGPAGVEGGIVGTPASRCRDDEPLPGRQDVARAVVTGASALGDNRPVRVEHLDTQDSARWSRWTGCAPPRSPPRRRRRHRSPAWSPAGRPAPGAPVPPGAARRCGRCRRPNTTGCRRGRVPRP